MKKILILVIVLILTCSMLVSCDNAKSLLKKADAALEKKPYAVTMKMKFECDDAEINRLFSHMNIEIPMTVDGKNVAMNMKMDIANYTTKAKIIIADMVMYGDIEMLGQTAKVKTPLNEDQYKDFMEENNTEMAVTPEDFAKLTVESKDGRKYITCEEISKEGLKELNAFMAKSISGIKADVAINNVTNGITLSNGKYESMDLTLVYAVTVADETHNVTVKMNANFSYNHITKITAPADANKYEDVSYNDLMG